MCDNYIKLLLFADDAESQNLQLRFFKNAYGNTSPLLTYYGIPDMTGKVCGNSKLLHFGSKLFLYFVFVV